ncbi:MAG: electron transport complex subunit RsxG [Gammaproteobacteria bacterium]|nr:electron transport complex subunit RsxG [Gammaproteobacteria bacterium]
MLQMALLLGAFTVIGAGMVALTHDATAERIAIEERTTLLRALNSLVPSTLHDNDISADIITVASKEFLGTDEPVTVYRARLNDTPVAAIMSPIAPDGYSGAIKLLVAIRYDGTLSGVRVIAHHETPGLGDAIEIERSGWITAFDGKSLSNPDTAGWRVKKDGGAYDQFTGATITPRAVVKAVHKCLQYFSANREALFASLPTEVNPHGK